MQSYEAYFLPPDSEYMVPDHSETSEIIEGRRHFAHVIRNLAEYHADEKDGVFRLSYEREQELAEAVYAGRLVEAKRAEKAAAEAARAAAEAKAAEQATAESSEEPAAELSTNAAKETGTSRKKPELADGMAHLDELDNVEDKADTQEIEVAELSEEDKADEAILQAAARARKVLVEANARLALYFARASVGLQPQARRLRRKGSKGDIVTEFLDAADVAKLLESPEAGSKPVRKTRRNSQKRYRPKDKTVGTYTNIANLASKHAELEDRGQAALVGLIKAAANCKPHRVREEENPGKKLKPARFATFAAWAIHREITASIESTQGMETLRPRAPLPDQDAYYGNRKLFGVEDLRDITLEQYREKKGNDKGYWDLENIQTWMEREVIYFDDMEFPHAAHEEQTGYEGEEQPLTFDEMFSSVEERPIINAVDYELVKNEIDMVLATLSKREAGVLRLRFGLSDGKARSLDEIGEVYGVTRARVSQIEAQTMTKMRHSSRKKPLRDYLDFEGDGRLDAAHFYAGDGMRTERAIARLSIQSEVAEKQESYPRLPVSKELLASLNFIEHIPNERPSPNARAYREVNEAFQGVLEKSKWQFWADKEMHKSMGGNYLTSYPDVCNIIDEYFGDRLTVGHIATAWNELLFNLRYPADTEPANRIGQLTSRLLSTRMKPTDVVELRIPKNYDYECGFLGAWLRQGHLIIRGNAGDYVGMHMGGDARITVLGDVGYDAGFGASGNARLEITGSAARRAGQNIRDNAIVSMAAARTRGGLGKGRRDNARIFVGGEPLALSTPRRVIQMSRGAAENYFATPPVRYMGAMYSAQSEMPSGNEAEGRPDLEAGEHATDLDALNLAADGIAQRYEQQITDEAPEANTSNEPQTIPPPVPSAEKAAESTDTTPAPDLPGQDEENEEADMQLNLEAVSAYFDIRLEAFQKLADQVGYGTDDLLRIDDIVAMQALIPVLRLPAVPESGYITVAEAAQRIGFRGTASQFAKDLRELGIEIHRFRTYEGKAVQFIDENNI